MKQLNLKFLLLLFVPLVVGGIGLVFLHDHQAGATEEMWLAESEKAQKAGDTRGALKQLEKYLRKHPEDREREREAAHLAADILLAKDDTSRTSRDYHKALRRLQNAARNTSNTPEERRLLERRLIDVFVEVGHFSDAESLVKQHLKLSPDDPKLAYIAARTASAMKREEERDNPAYHLSRIVGFLPRASSPPFFNEKAALDGDNIQAFWDLAAYYRDVAKDAARGDRVIKGMFRLNEAHKDKSIASLAYFHRGRYRQAYQTTSGTTEAINAQSKKARQEIENAIELDKNNEMAWLTIAELDVLEQDYDAAEKVLDTVLKNNPDSMIAYKRLARLSEIRRDLKEALAIVNRGLKRQPGQQDLLWYKCRYQLDMRDGEGMDKTIAEMDQEKLPHTHIQVAKATRPICDLDWNEAAKRLEEVKPLVGKIVGLYEIVQKNLAMCYRQNNEPERELAIWKEMASHPVFGQSDEILARILRSLISQSRMHDAWEMIQPRLERSRDIEDVPVQIRILAEEVLRWRKRNQFTDTETPGIIADTNAPLVDIEGNLIDWMGDDDFWQKVYAKTRSLLKNNDGQKAFQFIEEALEFSERDLERMPNGTTEEKQTRATALAMWSNFYYFYIGMILEQNGLEKGIALAQKALADLRAKQGDNPRIVIETARILTSQPTKETVELLKPLEERISKFETDQQPAAWVQVAAAYLRTGRSGYDDAKRCWQQAIKLAPNHKPTLQQSFQFALQTDDEAGMNEVIDAIEHAVTKNDPLWKYARAYYLIRSTKSGGQSRANLQEAIELADSAMEEREGWSALYELRGQINESLGETEAAISDYENARRRGSQNPKLLARLLDRRIQAGQINEARAILDSLGPTFPGVERQRIYVDMLLPPRRNPTEQTNSLERMIAAIEKYIPAESSDWKSYIEKGELYKQAARRYPEKEQVKELYGLAEVAYRSAVSSGRYRPEAWLALVNFLLGTKQSIVDAEEVLRTAEAELPDDVARPVMAQGYVNLRDFDQAEHYLLSIAAAEPDDLRIRKALVEYYLRTRQVEKAVPELEQMIMTEGSDEGEALGHVMWARRQKAALLLRSGSHEDFQKAIAQVEANIELLPQSLQDTVLKAQILANRTEPRYQRQGMELLESIYESDPKFLNFDATLLLARLYYRDAASPSQDRWSRASRLMDSLLDQAQADGEDRSSAEQAALLAQLGSMLLDRGDEGQATTYIQSLNGLQPNAPRAIRLLAKWHLARRDRRNAEQVIMKLVPKDRITNENAPLLLQAAQLLDEQNLDDQAEKLFRRLAEEHPQGHLQLAEYLASRGTGKEGNEAIAIASKTADGGRAQDLTTACYIGLMALRQLGNNATARQRDTVAGWFEKARTVEGTRAQMLRLRLIEADFAILTDNHAMAVQIFRDLLQRSDLSNSEEGQIANNLAYLLAARGEDLDEAMRLANRAQTHFGPNASVLDTKGVVHLMKGECEQAKESLEEATSMDAGVPGFSDYARRDQLGIAQMYFHLALAYKCVDDRDRARVAWENAQSRGFRPTDSKPLKREMLDELLVWINTIE